MYSSDWVQDGFKNKNYAGKEWRHKGRLIAYFDQYGNRWVHRSHFKEYQMECAAIKKYNFTLWFFGIALIVFIILFVKGVIPI